MAAGGVAVEEEKSEREDLERLCRGVSPSNEPCNYRRLCTARRAGGGSVMPTPRTMIGIPAHGYLVISAAKHRSHRHRTACSDMTTSRDLAHTLDAKRLRYTHSTVLDHALSQSRLLFHGGSIVGLSSPRSFPRRLPSRFVIRIHEL